MTDQGPLLYDPDNILSQSINQREELDTDEEYEPRPRFDHHLDDTFIAISPYLVELLGTYFLTLIIGLTSLDSMPSTRSGAITVVVNLGPLAVGSGLMVLIFFGGHLSGAHYNPCVTIAAKLTFRDHIGWLQSIIYIICQNIGAILAGFTYWAILDDTLRIVPTAVNWKALLVEFIFSFLLASVMINTATTKSQTGNSFFGLAIGFTVLTAGYAIGPISGAVLNPAVGTGAALSDWAHKRSKESLKYFWIYWVGPVLGGIFAGILFRVTNAKEFKARRLEDAGIDHNYKLTHGVK